MLEVDTFASAVPRAVPGMEVLESVCEVDMGEGRREREGRKSDTQASEVSAQVSHLPWLLPCEEKPGQGSAMGLAHGCVSCWRDSSRAPRYEILSPVHVPGSPTPLVQPPWPVALTAPFLPTHSPRRGH